MTQQPNITLRQGLEKFYTEYQSQLSHNNEGLPKEVKAFFRSHDIAHVLFACDISLYGEGSVKVWTIFGTTLGFWQHIKEYKKANAFDLSRNFSLAHALGNGIKLILSIPSLIFKAKRMNRPWPWSDFDAYLDTPISEVRREFNIHVSP